MSLVRDVLVYFHAEGSFQQTTYRSETNIAIRQKDFVPDTIKPVFHVQKYGSRDLVLCAFRSPRLQMLVEWPTRNVNFSGLRTSNLVIWSKTPRLTNRSKGTNPFLRRDGQKADRTEAICAKRVFGTLLRNYYYYCSSLIPFPKKLGQLIYALNKSIKSEQSCPGKLWSAPLVKHPRQERFWTGVLQRADP